MVAPVSRPGSETPASIGPPDSGIAGCRLSGDPVAWLLALYGRVGWEELLRRAG